MIVWAVLIQTVLQVGNEPRSPDIEKPAPLPLSTAVYPPGVMTEPDYVRALEAEHESLLLNTAKAAAASVPRWQAHHAAWLLAVRCEPPLTRLILDISDPSDLTTLAESSRTALELLQKAEQSWPQDDTAGRELLEWFMNLARAAALLAQSRQSSPDSAAIGRVANELAVWVDDDNPEVASATLLWASLLYHEAGQADRALQLLPLALKPVEGRVGDFYLRVLRFALLARQGRATLALALLLKMEERCERWLPGEALQNSALCTLAWLRARMGAESTTALGSLARQSVLEAMQRAHEVYQNEDTPCTLLRLRLAAPVLFPKPDANSPQP